MNKIAKNSDKVYTPEDVAKRILSEFDLYGTVLDPCCGNGAFYDNYPSYVQKDFCETDLGKDFFDYNKHVDWIVSNPPYSIFTAFLEHSFEIADNVVFLIPYTMLSTDCRIRMIMKYGGIKKVLFIAGKDLPWSHGRTLLAVHFQRNYHGLTEIRYLKY